MLVFSPIVTRSTGTIGGDWSVMSSFACCNVMSAPRKMQACSSADARNPAGLSPRRSTGKPVRKPRLLLAVRFRLGDIGDEPDMGKARGTQKSHDLHHATVIDRA